MDQPALDLVRGVRLFAGVEGKDLDRLRRAFRERRYAAGQVIVAEGEEGLLFFVVESGTASVSLRGEEVGRLAAGDAFGEIALVDLSARSATVTAETPVRCWTLASWSFRPFVRAHPDVAWALLELLAERLRAAAPVDR